MQSKRKSSNQLKSEKSFKISFDESTSGSFVRWFSAFPLSVKFKLWTLFIRNEYLSGESFASIYLHFSTRFFESSSNFEKWSRMLNSCNQNQPNQKTQLTALKKRIWFHSYWTTNDFHSSTQKCNSECHQKISKKLVIILNVLVSLFVVKIMQGFWMKRWIVKHWKIFSNVRIPMIYFLPYSVTEIRSPFKSYKTADELIKTLKKRRENHVVFFKKPNPSELDFMEDFQEEKTQFDFYFFWSKSQNKNGSWRSAFVWIANPQRLAIVF